ncbi:hypothetical protein [Microvirga arabica]|uniref:hypothetical protein n=1 Tax=Microvirga arabica TaxID=1128671 RepID=UPI00193A219A|nr:hypothetical protein [Microvirga arabica]MBM1172154.1 hypothetical protein [Microvirga arabica]
MKDPAIAPEVADPYATLEKILKVIGRSWLSEEWRLEDIRILAQEALLNKGSLDDTERAKAIIQSRLRMKMSPEAPFSSKRGEGLPT